MKSVYTVTAFVLSAMAYASLASANTQSSSLGVKITVTGDQAIVLMAKINGIPGSEYVINTPVVTRIRYKNIICQLTGSHGNSASRLGEYYECIVSL